jgi:hypothetical protein
MLTFGGVVMGGVLKHGLRFLASATVLAALAACGGGGGGDKQTDTVVTVQPASVDARSGDKIRLGGVVSKGLLGNANVKVWPVKTDGTVDKSAQPLATGQTLEDGSYLMAEKDAFTVTGPFIVEVSAKPCTDTATGDNGACSYHQDESLGQRQYLPASFTISAIVTAPPADDSDDVSRVNVTLFSELAFQAASTADGGLTANNMAQAQAMINNLFGTTDLNTVKPKALSSTLTPAEARLAAMLTAASEIANDQDALVAIGCAKAPELASAAAHKATTLIVSSVQAGTPEATVCVVGKLAGNATTNSYVGTDPAITALLNTALLDVAQAQGNAELLAVVSTTSDKLTNPSLSVPAPASSAGAYDTIKAFFNDLVNTARTLFDTTNGASNAATLVQAHQFEDAAKRVQFTAKVLENSSTALFLGANLISQYTSTNQVSRFDSAGSSIGNLGELSPAGYGCWLVNTNLGDTVPGDPASGIDHVECYADYTYTVDFNTIAVPTNASGETGYRAENGWHFFILTPVRDASGQIVSFTYESFARTDPDRTLMVNWTARYAYDQYPRGASSASFDPQVDSNGAPRIFTGTVNNLVIGTGGKLERMTISGQVPDAFNSDGTLVHATTPVSNNLAFHQLALTVSLSNAYDASGSLPNPASGTFNGSLAAFAADGSTKDYDLALNDGALTIESQALRLGSFSAVLKTATTKFEGSLSGSRTAASFGVADITITGKLYNDLSATAKPFIDASLQGIVDNSHFDTNLPFSASNYKVYQANFDGFVTAPNSPKLRVKLTAAGKQTATDFKFGLDSADAISGDYFIYNSDSSLKRDVTFTIKAADNNSSGKARVTSEIVDPTNKVSFAYGYNSRNKTGDATKADTNADVYVNKVKRGLLDLDGDNLPKVSLDNGEFFSLDFGTIQY